MSTTTAPGLSRGLQAEALAFQRDMRELGSELGQPRSIEPEVLARRFYRNAVSVARQHPFSTRRQYLEEVLALIQLDLDTGAISDPSNLAFLKHLRALLNEAVEEGREQYFGLNTALENG